MTTFTRLAFERAHSTSFWDNETFFRYFQAAGCYLDDLCHEPVDKMPKAQREAQLIASIDGLAQRLREKNPAIVAIALKKIEPYVRAAIELSGIRPLDVAVLPFAGNGHQGKYIDGQSRILRQNIPVADASPVSMEGFDRVWPT